MRRVLTAIDPSATCHISTSADLGFPGSIVRLAGGFATGCVVQWECEKPIIPVDTVASVDLSTVIMLDRDPSGMIAETDFDSLRERINKESTYDRNYHRSNHFIVFGRRASDGAPALIIHSSVGEFDYQLNGLFPATTNWFADSVRTYNEPDGYLKLLIGRKAEIFSEVAQSLLSYAQGRHNIVGSLLLDGKAEISDIYHKPHFFMPTSSCIVLGCYLCEPNEVVPVFSRPGEPIAMFECESGGSNSIVVGGTGLLAVPHGWGRTIGSPVDARINGGDFIFNGHLFPIDPSATLGSHPDVYLRRFDVEPDADGSFFRQIASAVPGRVVDSFDQLVSYSSRGFLAHPRPNRLSHVE